MTLKSSLKSHKKVGTCIGAGYIALDVVFNEILKNEPSYWAGGSCGNILSILSFWNWNSYPISRLGDDAASKLILKDVKSWGVKTKFISIEADVDTPIVIERIKKQKTGKHIHKFEWICPNCGSELPHYRPILVNEISSLIEVLPIPQVFYFDRISKSNFELASFLKSQGSIIFFEPSGIKKSVLFEKCLQISDIVKYSEERIEQITMPDKSSILLEIQTLGETGLRYKYFHHTAGKNKWITLKAYPVDEFSDSAGSGDWCSAGIIHFLGKHGKKGLTNLKEKEIEKALNYSQALASLNCMFDGARGLMYSNLSNIDIENAVLKIQKKMSTVDILESQKDIKIQKTMQLICKNCSKL